MWALNATPVWIADKQTDGDSVKISATGVQLTRSNRARKAYAVVTALLVVAVLTACGAKIDTLLTVNLDGSGSRVMTLTLPADQVDEIKGGAAAVDSSINSHLPKQLSYSGIQTLPDGALTTTLTLNFTSTQDYTQQVSELLKLGSETEAPLKFSVADTLLISGMRIEETFDSANILQWLFDGLTADGIISGSNTNEIGSTTLEFDGTKYEQSSGRYDITLMRDDGFEEVLMQTKLKDADSITRTITYRAANAADVDLISQYFEENTPDGAKLQSEGNTWKLSFSGDATSVAQATDVALGTTGSKLNIEATPLKDDPASLQLSIVNQTSCEGVCSPLAPALVDLVKASAGFDPQEFSMEVTTGQPMSVKFIPPFSSIEQTFSEGLFGGYTASTVFTIPNSSIDLVGDGFETMLRPEKKIGAMSVNRGETFTRYTVTISADSMETFTQAYSSWAPDGGLGQTGPAAPGDTGYVVFRPGLSGLIGAHGVTGDFVTVVAPPFGKWVSAGSGSSVDGAPVEFQLSGLSGVVLAILVVVFNLIALALVLLLVHRKSLVKKTPEPRQSTNSFFNPAQTPTFQRESTSTGLFESGSFTQQLPQPGGFGLVDGSPVQISTVSPQGLLDSNLQVRSPELPQTSPIDAISTIQPRTGELPPKQTLTSPDKP